jgi:hypothetical protein
VTRARDISDRTPLDRVLRAISVSPSGCPSTTANARSIESKADIAQKQLREFERAGLIRYDAELEGWERPIGKDGGQ